MKKMVLLAVAMIVAVTGVADDTAATRAAAEKLLDLFNMDDTFEQTMQQATQMPLSMIDAQDLSESEKQEARAAVESSMKITMEKFSWDRMKTMFVDIYAEVLSMEELQGLIEFYESPIGQKFVKKQPELATATMQKMQTLMQEIMPEIQREVAKSLEASQSGENSEQ